jgi:hypothetical protein
MSQRLPACIATAILLGSMAPALHAERAWHEVEVGGIRIVSAAGAAQTEKMAADVEMYFEAARRVIGHANIRPLLPVNMLILDASLWRKYVDSAGRVAGMFQSYPASAEIVVGSGTWTSDAAIVFHELTHLVLRQNEPARALPAWYNEGHAELLSTIEVKNGQLRFGMPSQQRWQSLRALPWLPIEKILTESPWGTEIRGRQDVAAFYAQSWLMIHHAVFEKLARGEQLRRYRQLLVAGQDPKAAFTSVFGTQLNSYEMELYQYARRERLAYVSLPLDSLSPQPRQVRKLSDADALDALGRWVIDTRRVGDRQLKLLGARAKKSAPDSLAALQYANALIQHGDAAAAQPLIDAACVEPTRVATAMLCGDAYWEQFSPRKVKPAAPPPDVSLAASARKFYELVLRQEPDNLEALLSAAATFAASPADSSAVRAGLESALQRIPNNSRIAAQLSELYRPLDLYKARDYMERAVLTAGNVEQESEYARELNRIGSELASQ